MDVQTNIFTGIRTKDLVTNKFNNSRNRSYAFLYDGEMSFDKLFTQEEIELMFYTLERSNDYLKTLWGSWMKARDLCILSALRYMLLRPKEACHLKFSDFCWDRKLLRIRAENNKERKERMVFIPDLFKKYYDEFMSFPCWMWKDSVFIFPSAENFCLSSGRWKHIFREKILKPAGLYREGTRSYLLRKTGATEMLDMGADAWTVAQTLGHSDLRTVKNYYFQTNSFRRRQGEWLNRLK